MAATASSRSVAFSLRFKGVFFPFETLRLAAQLQSIGFLPTVDPALDAPVGANIQASGILARKSNTALRVDPSHRVMALHGPDSAHVVDAMDELEGLIKREFGLDSEAEAEFYEFGAGFTVQTGKNPLAALATSARGSSLFDRVAAAIGQDIQPFGYRFSGRGQNPNSDTWVDVRIEPLVQAATRLYLVELVGRNPLKKTIVDLARGSEKLALRLVNEIEVE